MSCLKDGRRSWNKTVSMLFNKVIGENEKCVFYFYLKTKQLFGQHKTHSSQYVLRQPVTVYFPHWHLSGVLRNLSSLSHKCKVSHPFLLCISKISSGTSNIWMSKTRNIIIHTLLVFSLATQISCGQEINNFIA